MTKARAVASVIGVTWYSWGSKPPSEAWRQEWRPRDQRWQYSLAGEEGSSAGVSAGRAVMAGIGSDPRGDRAQLLGDVGGSVCPLPGPGVQSHDERGAEKQRAAAVLS